MGSSWYWRFTKRTVAASWTRVRTLPRLVSVLLVAAAHLPRRLARFGRLLLHMLGPLGLHVELGHRLLQLVAVLRDRCCHVVSLGTRVALLQAAPEVVSQVGHLPGVEVHPMGQHVAPDLFGQLDHVQQLEEDAVLLPGGQ